MVSRKRGRAEMEAEPAPTEPSTLDKLRNMWQFASFMQYIYLFGKAVKIDDSFDIEELEQECLKPTPSEKLKEVGLALLKYVSSHKGLTLDIFDEYARRQYVAKAPQRNPFGEDDEPKRFDDFDVFTKIRVLHQLSTWTLHNPDRIREKMAEQRDTEQTAWRMEPLGWDAEDRSYYVLDDDRLYRLTDAPLPPEPKSKPKAKARKGRGTRSSKRRKVSSSAAVTEDEADESTLMDEQPDDDGFGGQKWELIAITEAEYNSFLESIRRSRDPNEKAMYARIVKDVMPVLREREEEKQRKAAKMQKELEIMQKLATAKRSSRLADKHEKQREREQAEEAERKRLADLAMAKKEQERQRKMQEARESRMMTRERRLKEREARRILHEEELRRLEEDKKRLENSEGRISERQLRVEMERRQQELQKMAEEEEWVFDCAVCGVHGENLDDGSHSIACEKCNVWQHSACHNIPQQEAEREDFHFICDDCKKRAEEAAKPKLPPLKFFRHGSAVTEQQEKRDAANATPGRQDMPSSTTTLPGSRVVGQLDRVEIPVPPTTMPRSPYTEKIMNGPSLSPRGQAQGPPPGLYSPDADTNGMRHSSYGMSSPPVMRPFSSVPPNGTPVTNGDHGSLLRQSPSLAPTTNGTSSQLQQARIAARTNALPAADGNFSSFETFTANNSFTNGYDHQRPMSAHSNGVPSPTKRQPSASPYQSSANYPGHIASSPASSFPPSTAQPLPSYSPLKQASSPFIPPNSSPLQGRLSSPVQEALAGSEPGYSPEKHDVPRPSSSHSVASARVIPPIEALEPSEDMKEVIRTPPRKKMSPLPAQQDDAEPI